MSDIVLFTTGFLLALPIGFILVYLGITYLIVWLSGAKPH
jgi:hypothetical protein